MGYVPVIYRCPDWLPDRWWKPLVRGGLTVELTTEKEVQKTFDLHQKLIEKGEPGLEVVRLFSREELIRYSRYGTVRWKNEEVRLLFRYDFICEQDSLPEWWLYDKELVGLLANQELWFLVLRTMLACGAICCFDPLPCKSLYRFSRPFVFSSAHYPELPTGTELLWSEEGYSSSSTSPREVFASGELHYAGASIRWYSGPAIDYDGDTEIALSYLALDYGKRFFRASAQRTLLNAVQQLLLNNGGQRVAELKQPLPERYGGGIEGKKR